MSKLSYEIGSVGNSFSPVITSDIIGDPFDIMDEEEYMETVERRPTRSRNDTVSAGSQQTNYEKNNITRATVASPISPTVKSLAVNTNINNLTLNNGLSPRGPASHSRSTSAGDMKSPNSSSTNSTNNHHNNNNTNGNNSDDEDLDEFDHDAILNQAASGQTMTNGKKQGFGLSVKKFWATKTAQSRLGRAVIASFLGEEGNKTLDAIRSAIEKLKGASKAKEMKTTIIRMAIKAKLLQDEKLITKKDVWTMADPVNNLAMSIYFTLKPRLNTVKENELTGETEEIKAEPADPLPLINDFVKLRDICISILKPHMKLENLNKLREVFDYLGGAEFLQSLVNNVKFIEEKHIMYMGIRRIVQPLLAERKYDRDLQKLCSENDCMLVVIEGGQLFRGSTNKCIIHHDDNVNNFLNKPTVNHFLMGDGRDYFPFQQLCCKYTQRYTRKLYTILYSFTNCKHNVRHIFADEIYKKYLKKNSTHRVIIPDSQLSYIETLLQAKEFIHCFDELKQDLYKQIDNFFNTYFIKSNEYKQYVQLYKLPPFLQKECNKLREQMKKKEKQQQKKKPEEIKSHK